MNIENTSVEKPRKMVIAKISEDVVSKFNLHEYSRDIVMWDDRLKYVEKHIKDYDSLEQFEEHIELIPNILNSPDYIGIHPNGKSLEFVKMISRTTMVAVRLNAKGELAFRTMYPLRISQFESYVKSGRLIPFSEISDVADVDEDTVSVV